MTPTILITSIKVEDRQRKDLGDVADLAASMAEHGLIQPIVLNFDNRLIAGERRLRAAESLGWTSISFVYKETLSEEQLTMLELEENIRRKEMTWQEQCRAIDKVHQIKLRQSAINPQAELWTHKMTGLLLGVSRSTVTFNIQVIAELNNPDSGIHQCTGYTDAIKWLIRRREDEALAVLASRTLSKPLPIPTIISEEDGTSSEFDSDELPIVGEQETLAISKMFILGDCLKVLDTYPPESFDHCITDPPYGIDMAMLSQQNSGIGDVDRVEAEHDVRENRLLLSDVIPEIYRVLKKDAFFVLWCDITNWQFIYDRCQQIGFKVQRWPLTWVKTHQCINQAAQYNFTKSTEIAMVCRKGNAMLAKSASSCVIHAERSTAESNPFAKPFAVWEFILDHIVLRGQTILDPFAGEGSSLQVFASSWNPFVGIEINEKHYNAGLVALKAKFDIMYRNPFYT